MQGAGKGADRHDAFDAATFDAKRERWTTSFSLIVPRVLHTATARLDGSIVIAGGGTPSRVLSRHPVLTRHRPIDSTELLSGARAQPGPVLGVARLYHSAIALTNGEVLVIGGIGSEGEVLNSVERLDPSARRWQPAPRLTTPRYDATVVVLGDGRVLVIGGRDQQMRPLASVEVLDPLSTRWRPGPSLPALRAGAVAIALSNSDVLLVGGVDATDRAVEDALLFRSDGEQWMSAGRAPLGRAPAAVALDRNDALLVANDRTVVYFSFGPKQPLAAAGGESDQVQVWDSRHDAWSDHAPLPTPLSTPRAVALSDGRILVVGATPDHHFQCALATPDLGLWHSCPGFEAISEVQLDRTRPTLDRLADGRVLAILGRSQAALFDEKRGTWTPLTLRAEVMDVGAQRPLGQSAGLRVVGSAPLYSLLVPPPDLAEDGAVMPLDATAYAIPAFFSDAGTHLADGRFLAVLHSQRRLALWDSRTSTWQVRGSERLDESLGRTLLRLPDGCVLAFADSNSMPRALAAGRPRFAVIQPDTLHVSYLHGVFIDVREASFALAGGSIVAVGHSALGKGVLYRFSASCDGIDALGLQSLMPSGPGAPLRRLDPEEFLQRLTQVPPAVVANGEDELSLRDPAVILLAAGAMGSMVSLLLIPLLLPVAGIVLYRRLHRRTPPAG